MHKIKSIYITRVFALVNLVFVPVGVWIFAGMSGWWRRGFLPPVSSAPFALYFYIVDAIFVAAIFSGLVYSAARLLRGDALAARTARLVYICELLYIFVSLCIVPRGAGAVAADLATVEHHGGVHGARISLAASLDSVPSYWCDCDDATDSSGAGQDDVRV
jgi:hypothetical protein